MKSLRSCFFYFLMILLLSFPPVSQAEENSENSREALLKKAEELAREAKTLGDRSKQLSDEAQKLIERALSLSQAPVSQQSQISPQPQPSALSSPPQASQQPPETPKPASTNVKAKETLQQQEEQKEQERKQKQIAVGNILFPKGYLEIEPSFTYVNFSNNNLLIDGFALLPVFVAGQIESQRVRRNLLVESLNVSYGLKDDVQIQVESPLRFRSDEITASDNTSTSTKKIGLGDIRLGTSVQLHRQKESGLLPDIIGNLNVFFPTGSDPFDYNPSKPQNKDIPLGSGFWSVGTGLTTVKVSDPAVLFGGVNYTYNFPRDVQGAIITGHVIPGNSIGYTLGMAFSLNYQLTLNFQVEHTFTFKTKIDQILLNDSSLNDARLTIGATWAYSKNNNLNLSISAGLTEDAPDLLIKVSIPFGFDLKKHDK